MTGWVEVFYLGQWDKGQADPQGICGGGQALTYSTHFLEPAWPG